MGGGGPGGSVVVSRVREAKGFWSPDGGPERGIRLLDGRDMTLHEVRGDFRHGAALAFEEVYMGHELLTLQAVSSVNEAIGMSVDIRIVDLS